MNIENRIIYETELFINYVNKNSNNDATIKNTDKIAHKTKNNAVKRAIT